MNAPKIGHVSWSPDYKAPPLQPKIGPMQAASDATADIPVAIHLRVPAEDVMAALTDPKFVAAENEYRRAFNAKFGPHLTLLPEPKGCPQQRESAPGQFRVSVQRMVESHRTTYWVCIDRPDRPLDAKPWDEGRMTHYCSEHVERANEEGQAWAEFLGATFKPYTPKGETPQ